MGFRDFKMMHHVGIEIVVMAQPRGRQNLEEKIVHGLPLVRKGLKARFVETLPHGRRVAVAGAVKNIPFHTAATSTETFTTCLPPPVRMPATGLTSPKSRPYATVMCSAAGWRLFVGSKSTQPAPGQNTLNHAWLASAPTRRGLPSGGRVRK